MPDAQDQYIEPAWTPHMPAVHFFEARSGPQPLSQITRRKSFCKKKASVLLQAKSPQSSCNKTVLALVLLQEESHARGRFVVVRIHRSLTNRLCPDRRLSVHVCIVDWHVMTQSCGTTAIARFQAARLLRNRSLVGYFAIMRSVF